MHKIAIYNKKGGVGKTTMATLLTKVLLDNTAGLKILVLDLDPQNNFSLYYGLKKAKYGIEELLVNPKLDLESIIYRHESLGICSAFNEVQLNNSVGSMNYRKFEAIIDRFNELDYDLMIIDLPPSLNSTTMAVLEYTDHIVTPLELTNSGLKGLIDVFKVITEELMLPLTKVAAVVPNRVTTGTLIAGQLLTDTNEILEKFNVKDILTTSVPQRELIKKQANNGLVHVELDSEFYEIFEPIIKQIMGVINSG